MTARRILAALYRLAALAVAPKWCVRRWTQW